MGQEVAKMIIDTTNANVFDFLWREVGVEIVGDGAKAFVNQLKAILLGEGYE